MESVGSGFHVVGGPTRKGGVEVRCLDLVNSQGGGEEALLRRLLHLPAAPQDKQRPPLL